MLSNLIRLVLMFDRNDRKRTMFELFLIVMQKNSGVKLPDYNATHK